MLSDCKSDRTLPKAPCTYCRSPVRTDLQSARLNIGICNPAILFIALQMLIFNAVGLQIRQNITKSALHLLPKPRSYGFAIRTSEYRDLQSRNSFYRIANAYIQCCRIANPTEHYQKRPALIAEAPRAYCRSASRLSPKRLALIAEAPRAYFGGAGRFV